MMGVMGALWKALQYVPLAVEAVRMVKPEKDETMAANTQAELQELKTLTDKRLDGLTQEIASLRERLRQAENAVMALRLWIYIGLIPLAVLVFILLVVVMTRG